jgi:zinc protease
MRSLLICLLTGFALFTALLAGGPSYAIPPVERIVLPDGLVLLVAEERSLPFVTFELIIDAGAWRDPPQKGGLANLTAESILLGTNRRTISQINETLDTMGTSLEVSCGWDYVSLSLKSLKKELDQGFAIFMEILTRPAFPQQELQRVKQTILGAILSEKDDPMELARKRFREIVFVDSPYDHPVKGTEETLPTLTRDMVVEFYQTYFYPNIAILAVVGDITAKEVRERLVPRLNQWKGKQVLEMPVTTRFAEGPQKSLIDRPITQANIVLGHGGIQRSNPDFYAVSVMNRILGGGGLSSRLVGAIRVKRGLAYSVHSAFLANRYPGSFQLMLQTQSSSASEAIRLSLEEMKRMKREMVSEQELKTAKEYLVGSFPLRVNTQSRLAAFISQAEYYDLGLDYPERYPSLIQSITREDVLRVAREYLHPEETVVSIVGNLQEIKLP